MTKKKVTKKMSKQVRKKEPAKSKKVTKKTQARAGKKKRSNLKKAAEKSLLGREMENASVVVTGGKKTTLKKLSGKKGLVLYFYPKDNTPGCTTEACGFREQLSKLKEVGYEVVGVSGDSLEAHQKFTDKLDLNFPLVSDLDYVLCQTFEAYGPKQFMGREYTGILRKTFVLDKKLNVILEYPKVKVKEHAEEILRDILVLRS